MGIEINRIRMGKSNSYLIKGEDGFILVDAGMAGKTSKILKALEKHNAASGDIRLIVVTHVHDDHVGSLYDIKEKSKAPILVHEKEKDLLNRGYTKHPDGTGVFSKIISWLANNICFSKDQFKPVKADIVMTNFFDLSDYGVAGKALHTPGHTEGSICIIIDNKYCIAGDTLFNMFPNSVYPPFANDRKELLNSWKELRTLNCKRYYPGHGKEFCLVKFEETIKKLSFSIIS